MKKIFYAFIILLILLVIAIVSAVNSSIVIDKIAKKFAPDYNLSYEHISGNVFTGIKIDKLKYANKTIANDIIYKWNPVSLLQKKISIDEIKIEDADIDVIKSLIASFDVDDSDDNSSTPFTFDINVDNVFISLNPFKEEGISFNKAVLTADDVTYFHHGAIELKNLFLDVDSNLTTFSFKGSMKDNELSVDELSIKSLDSQMLEGIIAKFTAVDNSKNKAKKNINSDLPLNPLIPQIITVKHFDSSLQPRIYMGSKINKFNLKLDNLNVNISKLLKNKKNSYKVTNLELLFDSNNTVIDLKANMNNEKVTFEYLVLKDVDTLALKQLFMSDSNGSVDKDNMSQDEPNMLIPQIVIIKKLQTNILPTKYEPIEVEKLILNANDIRFNVKELLLKSATIDLNGTTNLTNLSYSGEVQDNHLSGEMHLTPNEHLFELYKLPLRKEAIGTIIVDFNASKERIVADVKAKAKHILQNKKGEFNVDIDSLLSHVIYNIKDNKLEVDSKAMVTTPYAKDITLINTFLMDNNITYKGEVKAKELSGVDVKFTKPLSNLLIKYNGDAKSITTLISSQQLKGSFDSKDFKTGQLHLETIESLKVSELVELPQELKETKVNVTIDTPLDFENIIPVKAKVIITSNIANIDADLLYGKTIQVKGKTVLPKDSLLKSFSKEVKWDALTPLDIAVDMSDKSATLKLKSKALNTDIKYFLDNGNLDGKINLGGLIANISGRPKKKLKIDTKITSMKSLEKSIGKLYAVEDLPPLEGSANISAIVTDMKTVELSLLAPKIIYKVDRKTKYIVNDIQLATTLDKSKVVLKSYKLTYDKQKYFSTKPSQVQINGDKIKIDSLWLNDTLKVAGDYNLKTKQGKFTANAKKMHFAHEYADVDSMFDLKTVLDGNNTSINGKVILLGGNIKYDMSQKSFASDSDIIIVQEMKKKKASPFMDNLSTNIQIETKKPLVYKKGPLNVKIKVGLGINKVQHGPLLVLGSVELPEGGSYIFENKKFVLDKSFIHFTGNPNKPLLEIKVKYKSINHLITINVTGTPEAPNINFSSSPSLTKEQILSVILFDSEAGGDTHSGDEMMKMMGGSMAKAALSDLGVKVDHLVLGEGNSIEVGKKLTNKITVIYVSGDVPVVKLKYQHGKHTESVIGASEESQSYDIIYKTDF